ncbi:MAG TPA: hypothetical protein VIL07_10195 [Symbiobacteriaceae bacterium]
MEEKDTLKLLQEHLLDRWVKASVRDRQRLVLEWMRLKEEMEAAEKGQE